MENLEKMPGKNKIDLLWEALEAGCSKDEARVYSGMDHEEWNQYFAKTDNAVRRLEEIQFLPYAEARVSLRKGVKDNPDLALKVLERRKPDEFAPTTKNKNEHSGPGGGAIPVSLLSDVKKNL